MKRNDGIGLASKFGIEFLGEKNNLAYFRGDAISAEIRDDLKDALGKDVVILKSSEVNPLELKTNRSKSSLDAVALSEQILRDGILKCCSDVHIEPADGHWRVRMRRNGTLFLYGEYDDDKYSELVTRIKIMSEMDIGERRRPQDGRFTETVEGKQVDVRVSAIPVKGREKLVLRLLDREGLDYTPQGIGLRGEQLEDVLKLLRQPQGLVFVTNLYAVAMGLLFKNQKFRCTAPNRKLFILGHGISSFETCTLSARSNSAQQIFLSGYCAFSWCHFTSPVYGFIIAHLTYIPQEYRHVDIPQRWLSQSSAWRFLYPSALMITNTA